MKEAPFRLYLVRHGEASYAPDGETDRRYRGYLNPAGYAQIEGVASWLAERGPFTSVFSSGLGRAIVSASIICDRLDAGLIVVNELNELTPFDAEQTQAHSRFVCRWAESGLFSADWDGFPAADQVRREAERIQRAARRILAELGFESQGAAWRVRCGTNPPNVLIVAHSGSNQAILSDLLGLPLLQSVHMFADDFGSVAVVGFIEAGALLMPVLKQFGEV